MPQQDTADASLSRCLRLLQAWYAEQVGPPSDTSHYSLLQVGKMGQAIHHHLCAIQMPQAKNSALRVITLLARNHIPELVAVFLDFSTPLDRYLATP